MYALSGSTDKTLLLWDLLRDSKPLRELKGHLRELPARPRLKYKGPLASAHAQNLSKTKIFLAFSSLGVYWGPPGHLCGQWAPG